MTEQAEDPFDSDAGFPRLGEEVLAVLETSRPGVFAVGDVRSGSIERVASAVGEGAMAVLLLHRYLASVSAPVPVER